MDYYNDFYSFKTNISTFHQYVRTLTNSLGDLARFLTHELIHLSMHVLFPKNVLRFVFQSIGQSYFISTLIVLIYIYM
jgi:hypothetical protein